MKGRVYLETSFISYLTARPSRDLVVAANQQVTQDWWHSRRTDFEVYVSGLVAREASIGDPEAAEKRLEIIGQLPLLQFEAKVFSLAGRLVEAGVIPEAAQADSLHVAIAAVNGMDYLLTWNFKHIANATMRSRIEHALFAAGYEAPIICSPQELLEE